MEFSITFGVWRALRVMLILLVATIMFVGMSWVGVLFFPEFALYWQPGLFAVLALFSILVLGTPDDALRTWHEGQIISSRELYATLYNQSPVPYLTLDRNGKITTCNQSASRLFQTDLGALVGTTIVDRLSHEDETHLSVALGKFQSGVTIIDTELELTTYQNEKRWVSLSLFVSETFDQRLVSLVDMTHHKLVDTAKSEFVALATHQLRTPIAAIRWNVELLERSMRESATEKQTGYLVKVNRNVVRMIALINDFLSVSKLETGTFATTMETLSVREYLTTVVDEYQQAITEKQIVLEQSYEPADLSITTDSRLFHIITSNLLSNAVKYVLPSGLIRFGYELLGSNVVITVSDTGIGIPSEQVERLFTKFFRASNAQMHRAEGTGLGLYIVKESVEILGGTITVSSEENKGTTFVVTLPLG